jgi:transposase
LTERGTQAIIPNKRNRRVHHECHPAIYKQRNVIERLVSMIPRIIDPALCRFKDWRRVATRFDRNIKNFMATIAIAATVIWWLK